MHKPLSPSFQEDTGRDGTCGRWEQSLKDAHSLVLQPVGLLGGCPQVSGGIKGLRQLMDKSGQVLCRLLALGHPSPELRWASPRPHPGPVVQNRCPSDGANDVTAGRPGRVRWERPGASWARGAAVPRPSVPLQRLRPCPHRGGLCRADGQATSWIGGLPANRARNRWGRVSWARPAEADFTAGGRAGGGADKPAPSHGHLGGHTARPAVPPLPARAGPEAGAPGGRRQPPARPRAAQLPADPDPPRGGLPVASPDPGQPQHQAGPSLGPAPPPAPTAPSLLPSGPSRPVPFCAHPAWAASCLCFPICSARVIPASPVTASGICCSSPGPFLAPGTGSSFQQGVAPTRPPCRRGRRKGLGCQNEIPRTHGRGG
ncbi:uncharacterized protein [Canis lupus baileyi]|uniref:uncharacterized protein n=1 Tax=Canis lupus baileyi TaxID=143281 RepID=UPI003B97879C